MMGRNHDNAEYQREENKTSDQQAFPERDEGAVETVDGSPNDRTPGPVGDLGITHQVLPAVAVEDGAVVGSIHELKPALVHLGARRPIIRSARHDDATLAIHKGG